MDTHRKKAITVICDTNVWYWIAMKKFIPNDEVLLRPTQITLHELATSEQIATQPYLVQQSIKAIHDHHQKIIPVNPFDLFLSRQSSRFASPDTSLTNDLLKSFEDMMNIDFSKTPEFPQELLDKVREECKRSKFGINEFADATNSLLPQIRKNINMSTGKKNHLKEDRSLETKQFLLAFINSYLKTIGQPGLEPDTVDWSSIELFLKVTEHFFKKLETTKDMKLQPNDVVDWFNIMYVEPGDKYLTFEKSWRSYISNDPRIAAYLYT